MTVKLRIIATRKEGRPDFGSDGVGLELELDLADTMFQDFHLLQAHVSQGQDMLDRLVEERLEAHRQPAPPAEELRSDYVPRREREARQNGDQAPYERPPFNRTNSGKEYRGRPEVPQDGRQLLGWAKGASKDNDLFRLGAAWRLPRLVVEWSKDDVQAAYHELTAKPGNGRNGNGAAY
jgi:hypothetical protein